MDVKKVLIRLKLSCSIFILILAIFLLYMQFSTRVSYALEDDYKIGAEDILFISVWGNDQLSREVTVRPDGKISFPLLDDLKVSGLSCMEIKEVITKELTSYINKPEVTVIVESINNYKVYLLGAVNSPGLFTLKRRTSLLQLLSMAGGLALADQADLKKSYVLRDKERLPVNFVKLIEEGDITQDIELHPDDIIYVPDNFANRITVTGEVGTPGNITFKNGMTVLDAVLMSGGPTEDADLNDTKVVRKKTGEEETLRVKLKDIMKKGKLENNINLEAGDIVIVPISLF